MRLKTSKRRPRFTPGHILDKAIILWRTDRRSNRGIIIHGYVTNVPGLVIINLRVLAKQAEAIDGRGDRVDAVSILPFSAGFEKECVY